MLLLKSIGFFITAFIFSFLTYVFVRVIIQLPPKYRQPTVEVGPMPKPLIAVFIFAFGYAAALSWKSLFNLLLG